LFKHQEEKENGLQEKSGQQEKNEAVNHDQRIKRNCAPDKMAKQGIDPHTQRLAKLEGKYILNTSFQSTGLVYDNLFA